MFFHRILVLVALLLAVGACTAGSNPPQTAVGVASPPVLPAAIEREVGAAYPDAALQAYVDRVGQKLVRGSGLAGSYRFVVLDLPVVNAHALTGYVFVTRGLLAVLDDEAELAAALGHELGHLTQRHAAQRARARQGVLEAAVEAATTTGSVTVGRSVARDGLIALRRYSREQELEADRIGLGYVVQAGYRSSAMASLIDRLRQQAQLEAKLLGEAPDSFDQRSATSTHPAPFERKGALAGGRRGGCWRVRPVRLSCGDRRHVGRRCARRGLRARPGFLASEAEARLRGAPATSACSTTRTAFWASGAIGRCCISAVPPIACRAGSTNGCATR